MIPPDLPFATLSSLTDPKAKSCLQHDKVVFDQQICCCMPDHYDTFYIKMRADITMPPRVPLGGWAGMGGWGQGAGNSSPRRKPGSGLHTNDHSALLGTFTQPSNKTTAVTCASHSHCCVHFTDHDTTPPGAVAATTAQQSNKTTTHCNR